MKRIGSNGLEELETTRIKEGHTYFMGASSSPTLVYVEDIGENFVTYRRSPYYPEDKQKENRAIFEDLVASGTETMRDNEYRSHWIDRDTNLTEIQRSRIRFKLKDSYINGRDEFEAGQDIEKEYRRKYGLETNIGRGNYTWETTVNKENVSKIRDLPEIRVLESGKPKR